MGVDWQYIYGCFMSTAISFYDAMINPIRGLFKIGYCTSENRLDGKTVLITGCNTGLGKAAALELARKGAKILMACRNKVTADNAATDIRSEVPDANISIYVVDLSSFKSITQFVDNVTCNEKKIDYLINNAGMISVEGGVSVDGYDIILATNYLGPFMLTLRLLEAYNFASPKQIVNVSSAAHHLNVDFLDDQPNWFEEAVGYWYVGRYCQSKLFIVQFTRELARRAKQFGICVNTYDPGFVKTDVYRGLYGKFTLGSYIYGKIIEPLALMMKMYRTPYQGIQTMLHMMLDEEAASKTGIYYYECKPSTPSSKATDDQSAATLWEKSCTMTGLDKFKGWNQNSVDSMQ